MSRDLRRQCLQRASPKRKPQTSLVAGPVMMARGQLWGREDIEEKRGYLVTLISVERGPPFEDFKSFSDF